MGEKTKTNKKYEVDMLGGSLWVKIPLYALPLMFSGMLQLVFNATDLVVVGRFAGSNEMAAVGATGALINLLVNVFMGLSVGCNVLTAQFCGAKDERGAQEVVHTSILVSLISGVILLFIGWFASRPLLILMGTPDEVLDYAVGYMRMYFLGMPVMLLYNFGSSILRAVGDTRRPLYFLAAGGIVNVVTDLFFVIVLHMGVRGAALATVLSQALAAFLVLGCLLKADGIYRVDLKKLRIYKSALIRMIQIGLPAGIQGAVFSISNVMIQSSMNSFGALAVAGGTASSNLEGFVYTAMNAISQTAMSFTSQNYGAKKFKRMDQVILCCSVIVSAVGIIFGGTMTFLGKYFLGIYTTDPEVVAFGIMRMKLLCIPYFLCGLMEVAVGGSRGMGRSIIPMILALLGACGLRLVWIYTVFAWSPSIEILYFSYPLSWLVTGSVQYLYWWKIRKTVRRKAGEGNPLKA